MQPLHQQRIGLTKILSDPPASGNNEIDLKPRPRAHLVRYSGVLAPAARWRAEIVPGYGAAETPDVPKPEDAAVVAPHRERPRPRRNYLWSELMKRVFAVDVLACPGCPGRLRLIALIHPPETSRKILDCLGLPSRPPPIAPPRRPLDSSNF